MHPRMDISTIQPEAYQAMFGLEKFLAASPLPPTTLHLVKLRASQMNGCAFCVDMHSHTINAWNRIGVTLRLVPGSYRAATSVPTTSVPTTSGATA